MAMQYVPEKWDIVTFQDKFGILIFEIVEGRAGLSFVELKDNGDISIPVDCDRAKEPSFFSSATLDKRKLNERQLATLNVLKTFLGYYD